MAEYDVKIVFEAIGFEKVQAAFDAVHAAAEKSFTKLRSANDKFAKKLDATSRAIQRTGRVLTVQLTAPLVIFGKTAVAAAIEAENAWVRVQKVFDGTLQQLKGELVPAARELALRWGVSQVEIAEAMETLAAMGYEVTEIIEGTSKAVEVSQLGNLDLAKSMELVVAVMQNYGVRGEELTQTIADLNAVEDEGAARLSDMAVGLGRVASIAKLMHLGVKEVGAIMSVLIGRGEKATISARALKTIFSRMVAPTEEIAGLFDKLGINVEKTESQMTTMTKTVGQNENEMKRLGGRIKTTKAALADYEAGSRGANLADDERAEKLDELRGTLAILEDQYNASTGATETYTGAVEVSTGVLKGGDVVLAELAEKWIDLSEAQKIEYATIIAGRHHVDRMVKIMDDLTSESSEYLRIITETEDPQENMNRMFKALGIAQSTTAVQMGRLNERFRQFKEFVGRDIIPIIIPLIDKILRLADKFVRLDRSTRETIVRMGILAAALGPVLVVIGMVGEGLAKTIIIFLRLRTVILAVWGGLNLLTGGFAAVVVAIAAATAVIATLILQSDLLKTKTDLVTQAEDRLRLAQDNLRTSSDLLRDATDRLTGANLSLEGAQLAQERATINLDDAIRIHGEGSLEAREAQHQLDQATQFLKTSEEDQQVAAENLTEAEDKHEEKIGEVISAQSELEESNSRVETSFGRIKSAIQGVIDKFNEWTRMEREKFETGERRERFGMQHGGIVPGSAGSAVPIMAHAGERVTPRSGADVGGSGASTININISGSFTLDDPARLKELANLISRTLGRQTELAQMGAGW